MGHRLLSILQEFRCTSVLQHLSKVVLQSGSEAIGLEHECQFSKKCVPPVCAGQVGLGFLREGSPHESRGSLKSSSRFESAAGVSWKESTLFVLNGYPCGKALGQGSPSASALLSLEGVSRWCVLSAGMVCCERGVPSALRELVRVPLFVVRVGLLGREQAGATGRQDGPVSLWTPLVQHLLDSMKYDFTAPPIHGGGS